MLNLSSSIAGVLVDCYWMNSMRCRLHLIQMVTRVFVVPILHCQPFCVPLVTLFVSNQTLIAKLILAMREDRRSDQNIFLIIVGDDLDVQPRHTDDNCSIAHVTHARCKPRLPLLLLFLLGAVCVYIVFALRMFILFVCCWWSIWINFQSSNWMSIMRMYSVFLVCNGFAMLPNIVLHEVKKDYL